VRFPFGKVIGCLIIILILAITAFTGAFLLFGDYSIELPHRYKLGQLWEGAIVLSGPTASSTSSSNIIVSQNVDYYLVYDCIIVGHRSPMLVPGADPGSSRNFGYFVVNIKNRHVSQGLTKRQWLNELRNYGVNCEPKLIKPSRFDAYLGRNKPQPLPN
jgi:hypothetical protein